MEVPCSWYLHAHYHEFICGIGRRINRALWLSCKHEISLSYGICIMTTRNDDFQVIWYTFLVISSIWYIFNFCDLLPLYYLHDYKNIFFPRIFIYIFCYLQHQFTHMLPSTIRKWNSRNFRKCLYSEVHERVYFGHRRGNRGNLWRENVSELCARRL